MLLWLCEEEKQREDHLDLLRLEVSMHWYLVLERSLDWEKEDLKPESL